MARILLIDDEPKLLAVMGEILATAGHEVERASDGIEGLAAMRRHVPDVIVCDINMPGLDGFGVLAEVRKDPALAALPFLFLTSDDRVRAGMQSGADDYLTKPVAAADLLAAIDARLARRDAGRREAEGRVSEVRRAVAVLLPHEIRTPLTTILGSAKLLREFHREFGSDEVGDLAESIVRAAERLHRMAENYILHADLELRRLSGEGAAGMSVGGSDDVDARRAAEDVAARHGRTGDLDVRATPVVAPIAPPYLGKVVSELCDNAFRFSPAGSRVGLTVGPDAGGGALVEVADGGRGMTSGQVQEIAAFRQFDRERFEQQGSGVGLALVKNLLEATGGRLEIESGATGTRVRARWPAADRKASTASWD